MSVTFASPGNLSRGYAECYTVAGQSTLEYWALAPPA